MSFGILFEKYMSAVTVTTSITENHYEDIATTKESIVKLLNEFP